MVSRARLCGRSAADRGCGLHGGLRAGGLGDPGFHIPAFASVGHFRISGGLGLARQPRRACTTCGPIFRIGSVLVSIPRRFCGLGALTAAAFFLRSGAGESGQLGSRRDHGGARRGRAAELTPISIRGKTGLRSSFREAIGRADAPRTRGIEERARNSRKPRYPALARLTGAQVDVVLHGLVLDVEHVGLDEPGP